MSQNNLTAPEAPQRDREKPSPLVKLVAMVPDSLRWEIKRTAAKKQMLSGACIVEALEQYVAREKGAAA